MSRPKETYNKKQRETKRLQQLKEKKQKAEERKAENKDKKFEDMIAYMDENGNLVDTPPDPSKRKVFAAEDILVSVPKLEDRGPEESAGPRKGKVSFYNRAKGFGFIQDANGERVFFHVQQLTEEVNEGDNVQFEISYGPRGAQAEQVSKAS